MHANAIPRKTDLARQKLQRRDALPSAQRLFLIMVDGRKSLRELSAAARQLDIDRATLERMTAEGLIDWPSDASPVAAPRPAAPAPAARPATSLAAAKLYAMDLAALMLPGQDAELRESSRGVTDADGLRAWLEQAATLVAARGGAERAALFLSRVATALPEGFAVDTATSA